MGIEGLILQFSKDIGPDLFPLFRTGVNTEPVVYTAKYPADRGLCSSFVKRIKMALHADIPQITCILKSKVVPEKCGQYGCGTSRNGTMAAGVFRKWGCLQERHPCWINGFINDADGPDITAPVFFIPA